MHTQTNHAEQITARGAHYILVVKGNQKKASPPATATALA
ncbi:hypothetical protein SHIRM173S_02319 [Streptomyces hirsutus]